MVFKRLFGKKGRFRGRDAHLTLLYDAKDDDGGEQFLLMSNDDDEDDDGGENVDFGGGMKTTLDLSQDSMIVSPYPLVGSFLLLIGIRFILDSHFLHNFCCYRVYSLTQKSQ